MICGDLSPIGDSLPRQSLLGTVAGCLRPSMRASKLWKGRDGMGGSNDGFAFEVGVAVVDGGGLVTGELAPDLGIGAGLGQFGNEGVAQGMGSLEDPGRDAGEFAAGIVADDDLASVGGVLRGVADQGGVFFGVGGGDAGPAEGGGEGVPIDHAGEIQGPSGRSGGRAGFRLRDVARPGMERRVGVVRERPSASDPPSPWSYGGQIPPSGIWSG